MREHKSVLQIISLIIVLISMFIPCRINSQTFSTDKKFNGLFKRQECNLAYISQNTQHKSSFSLGVGAKLFQPPSESNTSVSLSYGLTAEFQYIRNDVLTWYINLDYYTATYHSDIFNFDYKRNWTLALIGARIYPEKKSFGLNFNIAGGPVITDLDSWYAMFDLGAGYEIKLNEGLLLNPYICLHLFNKSGGESASLIPAPMSSFSLGATVSIIL